MQGFTKVPKAFEDMLVASIGMFEELTVDDEIDDEQPDADAASADVQSETKQ